VIYDSEIEEKFAQALDINTKLIKLYIKLPSRFTIDTPLGSTYNPDWGILTEKDGKEMLYFVVETKSTLSKNAKRGTENHKIACGKQHFEAISDEVKYVVSTDFNEFIEKI